MYALKLSWYVCLWHALVDLIFFGQSRSLHVQSQSGPELATNVWHVWSHTFISRRVKTRNIVTWEIQLNIVVWDCFQDSDFAEDLEVSKSTSGGTLCTFGSHTFVLVSWVCKKQTSVSHSSTEPQIVSFDAGLRMDGIPALDLWDLVIDVLHSNPNQKEKFKKEREDPSYCKASEKQVKSQCNTQVSQKHTALWNVDFVSSNVNYFHKRATLYIFEDSEAVIKMIIEGGSPTLRHVSRTEQSCAWLVCLTELIQTINCRAGMLTPGINSQTLWLKDTSHVMNGTTFCVCSISGFSAGQSCSEAMVKRP